MTRSSPGARLQAPLEPAARPGGRDIDEALTPDSSRYWLADQWKPGITPPSLDKQFLRDYLETLQDWNKQEPAPHLPEPIVTGIRERYLDLAKRFGITI